MEMIIVFKGISKFIMGSVVLMILSVGHTVYAGENYKLWNNGNISTVDENKTWTVTFNKNVNIDTVEDSIRVYRASDNKDVEVNISLKGNNCIEVSPKKPYEKGKIYVLEVGNGVKDIYDDKISQPVKYNFRIGSEQNIEESGGILISSYEEYYNAVKSALENYDSKLVLNIENYDRNTYGLNVIDKIVTDYPELRSWYNSAVGTSQLQDDGSEKLSIDFKYDDTRDNIIKKNNMVNAKVSKIVSSITNSGMKDYQKELALHDYVVNHAKYDTRADTNLESMPQDSYTAYGILINGVGVCQGYADAMYRLLKEAGIENKMVVGSANNGTGWVGHAWNIVKIQGQYYQLDATWDDPVTSDGSNVLLHDYFNITDSELSIDHQWENLQYPKCNSTKYNYQEVKKSEIKKHTTLNVSCVFLFS